MIQDSEYRIDDAGLGKQDKLCRIQNTGYKIQDSGYRIMQDFRIQDR